MKLLEKIGSYFDRAVDYLAILAILLVAFAMVAVSADVLMRYLFNRPITGVSEITEISLLYICFLSAAWVLKKEGHVEIEAAFDRLNLRTQLLTKVITSFLGALLCLAVVWYGTRVTWEQFYRGWHTPSVIEFPTGWIVVIIPIGSFFLLIQFLRRGSKYLASWKKSANKGEGANQ